MKRPTDDELEAQACKHDHAAHDPMLDNVTAVKRQLIIQRDKQTAAMLRACKSDSAAARAETAEAKLKVMVDVAIRLCDWVEHEAGCELPFDARAALRDMGATP